MLVAFGLGYISVLRDKKSGKPIAKSGNQALYAGSMLLYLLAIYLLLFSGKSSGKFMTVMFILLANIVASVWFVVIGSRQKWGNMKVDREVALTYGGVLATFAVYLGYKIKSNW